VDFQTTIEKTKKEWKEDPQKSEDESQVISKYGNMFNPKNIDNLTKENFISFLKSENNKHWRHIERKGPEITDDMEKLKSTSNIYSGLVFFVICCYKESD
jgi:hypothetical protein